MGLSIPEVAVISGHKDARVLFRYTHLRAEDLVNKISYDPTFGWVFDGVWRNNLLFEKTLVFF